MEIEDYILDNLSDASMESVENFEFADNTMNDLLKKQDDDFLKFQ